MLVTTRRVAPETLLKRCASSAIMVHQSGMPRNTLESFSTVSYDVCAPCHAQASPRIC